MLTKPNIDNNINTNAPKPIENKLNKVGLTMVLTTAVAALSTYIANPTFAEKNLATSQTNSNPEATQTLKTTDGEKVAGYFDNPYSREFNESIYAIRDTVFDCQELDKKISDALIQQGNPKDKSRLISCEKYKESVRELENVAKDAIDRPSKDNINKFIRAVSKTQAESTALIESLREAFEALQSKRPDDHNLSDRLAYLNDRISFRNNEGKNNLNTLLSQGKPESRIYGFDYMPNDNKKEFTQNHITFILKTIMTLDGKVSLSIINSTVFK